ncbi:MAG: hypothetical protein ACI81P_000108 [Neolewinella sp.]|jgi:hypothetical protein
MKRRDILRYSAYAAGFAVSAPIASAFFTSCKSDPDMKDTGYVPAFFSAASYAYISKMADTMLPSDGTPGALDVGVPQMIDKMIGEVYSKENQEKTQEGLTLLMKKMDTDNPGGFAALADDKALAYLQAQDERYKTAKAEVTMSGEDVPTEVAVESEEADAKSAYFTLKSMIISSFFNTEEVATTMLAYDPVPGEYIPCGDLQELTGGKAWAL